MKVCAACKQEWVTIHECEKGGIFFHLNKPTPESLMMERINGIAYQLYFTNHQPDDLTNKTKEELWLRQLVKELYGYFQAKVIQQCTEQVPNMEELN